MTDLQRRALAREPLDERCVANYYNRRYRRHNDWWYSSITALCESHERLRAELQGVTDLLDEAQRERDAIVQVCGLAGVGEQGQSALERVQAMHALIGQLLADNQHTKEATP